MIINTEPSNIYGNGDRVATGRVRDDNKHRTGYSIGEKVATGRVMVTGCQQSG